MSAAIQQSDDYENTFGWLLVKHRNEREMLEQDLVAAFEKLAATNGRITYETIINWQSVNEVPLYPEVVKAVTTILIDENIEISPQSKNNERAEFAQALGAAKAHVGKIPPQAGLPAFNEFARRLMRYKIQCGMDEISLAAEIVRRVMPLSPEIVSQIDLPYIAKVQANRETPMRGFAEAAIIVFARPNPRLGEKARPLSEREITEFKDAYERLPKLEEKRIAATRPRAENRPLATDRVKELRIKLRSYFVEDPSGDMPDCTEMNAVLSEGSRKLQTNDYTNFFSTSSTFVYSIGDQMFQAATNSICEVLTAKDRGDKIDAFRQTAAELKSAMAEAESQFRGSRQQPVMGAAPDVTG